MPARPDRSRAQAVRSRHPGILVALLIAAIALPLAVVIQRMNSAAALTNVVQVSSVNGTIPSEPSVVPSPLSTRPSPTTAPPTTASPTTVPTSVVTTTTVQPTTTSTTAAPPTTAPPTTAPLTTAAPPQLTAPPQVAAPAARAPVAPQNSETGEGTWYEYIPGGCANNTLPKGTRVTVTNLASGATTTCVVNDRGAFGPPRILDMDKTVFAQIADPGSGVIPIRISW